MRYYIVPDPSGFNILKVQAEDIVVFKKRYGEDIVCEADTLGELLLQFAAIIERAHTKPG
jgi:hypothetical protein